MNFYLRTLDTALAVAECMAFTFGRPRAVAWLYQARIALAGRVSR